MQPIFGNQQQFFSPTNQLPTQVQNPQMYNQAQEAFGAMPAAPQPTIVGATAPAPYIPRAQAVVMFNLPTEQNGYLSVDFYSPFVSASGKDFISVRHYLTYRKAQESGDFETAQKILEVKVDHDASTPESRDAALATIIQLGGQIKNYDENKWSTVLGKYLKEAIVYKFVQQPEMLKTLMFTENDFFVDADPQDRILGIGLDMATATSRPDLVPQWGANLLGKTLFEVRSAFRAEGIPQWAYGGDKPSSGRKEAPVSTEEVKPPANNSGVDIMALLNQVNVPPATPDVKVTLPEAVIPPGDYLELPSIDGAQITVKDSESESDEAK